MRVLLLLAAVGCAATAPIDTDPDTDRDTDSDTDTDTEPLLRCEAMGPGDWIPGETDAYVSFAIDPMQVQVRSYFLLGGTTLAERVPSIELVVHASGGDPDDPACTCGLIMQTTHAPFAYEVEQGLGRGALFEIGGADTAVFDWTPGGLAPCSEAPMEDPLAFYASLDEVDWYVGFAGPPLPDDPTHGAGTLGYDGAHVNAVSVAYSIESDWRFDLGAPAFAPDDVWDDTTDELVRSAWQVEAHFKRPPIGE